MKPRRRFSNAMLLLSIPLLSAGPVQTAAAQSSGGPVIRDSSVGYIDPAMPADIIRFRYDTTFNNRQPARAELFYPQAGASAPGLPRPEISVDFQEFSLYCERTCGQFSSAFINLPARVINPDLNDNSAGLGDLDAGFKYALVACEDLVVTSQLRVYAPTGDADRGLGNHHASIEPALLVYRPLSEQIRFEGELRYWAPIGGTDFAGDIIRYGAGLSYWPQPKCDEDCAASSGLQLVPVVEFVGWSVLDGKTSFASGPGQFTVRDAGGTTIVHVKAGVRTQLCDCTDLFVGYGRPLTGDEWYENTLRIELRMQY
jgi:hypothetical protein